MTTLNFVGVAFAVLGLCVSVSATYNGCVQEWGVTSGITCESAVGFVSCLRGLSDAEKQAAGDNFVNSLNMGDNVVNRCQANAKLAACGGSVSCANVQEYLDCVTAIDLTAIPSLKTTTDQNIAGYTDYKKRCLGQEALNTCRRDHVNADGKLSCDATEGYINCLKNIDFGGIATLEQARDHQVANLENSLKTCQAANAENDAHEKLTNCNNVHLTDNTYNCDNVKPFLACLEAADVSAYPTVQTRKDRSVTTAKNLDAQCVARAKIQTCSDSHSPIGCGNVESYIECLNGADVSADASASSTKAARLTEMQAFFKRCQAAAKLNNCRTMHSENGAVTCESVDAYTQCFENADVTGYDDLVKRRADTLAAMAGYKKQCEEQAAKQTAQVTEGETAGTANAELNECNNKFTGTCDTVAAFLACVEAVDTTGQADAQSRKENTLKDKRTFQRKCKAYDLLNGCTKTYNGACAGVDIYLGCLNGIDVSEFEETRKIKENKLASTEKFRRQCEVSSTLNTCALSSNGDKVIECRETAAYLECIRSIDASEFPDLQKEKETSITKFETQKRKCQGTRELNDCGGNYVNGEGLIDCGTVDGYLDCLYSINVNEFPTLVKRQTDSRTRFEDFKNKCDGNQEAKEANDKLNACISQNLESGVITCKTVGAYITCLENADVSNVATAQQRKTSELNKAKRTQRHCQLSDQLNGCSDTAGKGKPGDCENVNAYLACVEAINVSEFQDLSDHQTNIINTYTKFNDQCGINAKINECRAKHAKGGSYDCNTVKPYIACQKAIDASAAATLKTHLDDQIKKATDFDKANCGADSPRGCILTHAPKRRLNCVNSLALKACFDGISKPAPAAVTRKIQKCQEQKPIYECKMKFAPKNKITCKTGRLLTTCLVDLDTSSWKYAQVVRNSLVRQLRALLDKHCGGA